MNAGRTVFAQLLDLLPRRAFESAVQRYAGHRKVRRFSCMDQLLCMIFAQITGRSSLRETVSCLKALGARRYHCGIRGPVSRSTLAEANEKRDFRIFMDLAMAMIAATRIDLPVDRELARLNADAYGLDSTTIDLCLKLFPWAHFRRRKGGIKAHTLLDLRVGIPVFLRVTHAKTHDLWALDQITPQAGAFFITRAKKNLDFGVRQRQPVNAATGVISDRFIRLRGPKSRGLYPDTLRLIRYVDPLTGKRLKFLTNNLTLAAATVALLYRKRWRIELFFKWIKQHLHIKAFFGTSPNAVKTQIWAAVIVYVLVLKLKHRYQLAQDPNEIFQILSLTILEKTLVFELFSETRQPDHKGHVHKQLSLFE